MTADLPSNHEATFYLRSANLELTSSCNLRCMYCGVSQPGYRGTSLGECETAHAIEGLRAMRAVSVTLTGHGETTTVAGWHRTIARILGWGCLVHMTSNFARAFSDEELDAMLALSTVGISFDTDDPERLRRIRRSVCLETILDNVHRLQSRAARRGVKCPNLVASCVVHTENVMHIDRLVRFGIGHGIRTFQLCNMIEYPGPEGSFRVSHVANLPRQALVAARGKILEAHGIARAMGATCDVPSGLLDAIDDALSGFDTGAQVGAQKRYAKKPAPGQTRNCLDPWLFAFIQADASVRPCCYHPVIGSLKRQSLGAILNGEAAVALRRQLMTGALSESCRTCPARSVVGIEDLQKTLATSVPANSAAGTLARAALVPVHFARRLRVACLHPRLSARPLR